MKEASVGVSEEKFRELLQPKLTEAWDRALLVFNNYGPNLSFDVANVLLHASKQDKVDEILKILEEHYETHLQFQHPEIRGTVSDRLLGVNPTKAMFLRICIDNLNLQPNSS